MTTSTQLQHTLLALALASIFPLQAAAATSAGIAQFIAGDVNVRGADGKTDALLKGKDIESGQAIVTGANGRAQVKFSDGGLVSLQPNTEFKIASYVDKADPQEDRFLVDLLRGSMRAITGLIGKRNRANYKVTTTTATIGIRGSGFTAGYNPDGSMTVTAEKDAIEVCSGGVCVGLVAGESATVTSSDLPPVRTNNRASVPTPGTAQEVVTIGNQTKSDGSALAISSVTRTLTDVQVSAVGVDSSFVAEHFSTSDPTTTVFTDNKLTKFTDSSDGTQTWSESGTPAAAASFKSVGNVTDANFIGWGMWTTASRIDTNSTTTQLNQVHYVAGRPTPQSDISSLIGAQGSYAYDLVGSTAPTREGVTGTLSSATLTADFNASTSYSVQVEITTSFNPSSPFTLSASGTSASFSGTDMKGQFIGSNAAFAGMTYSYDQFEGGKINGALAFKKGTYTQPGL